mmetsp:Transcript_62899/g.178700  ORF Transcript_62899/g.178700 Transcript_62899/m.178700 type:complete len:237 (-) Transcript_62899:864-1574(-)
MLGQQGPELLQGPVQGLDGALLLLHLRDGLDGLDQQPAEHAHDRHVRQEDKKQEQHGKDELLLVSLSDDVHHLRAREGPVKQEGAHGGYDGIEPRRTQLRVLEHEPADNRGNVDDHAKQREHHADGAEGDYDAAHDHQDLRQLPHHPGEAQHPDEPEGPKNDKHAQVAGFRPQVGGDNNQAHDPGLEHNKDHQASVENEPGLPKAIPLPPERQEPETQLHHEERAEHVGHHLESNI